MNNLSIHVYDKQNASFKYDNNQVKISASFWNSVFDMLLKDAKIIYFHGRRFNYLDEEFEKTVFYLSDGVLLGEDPPIHLFCRIKHSAFLFNRSLLEKLWNYYDNPAFVFSYDDLEEEVLTYTIDEISHLTDLLSIIDGLSILYPNNVDSDFLWLRCSKDRPNLFFLKNL